MTPAGSDAAAADAIRLIEADPVLAERILKLIATVDL